MNWTLLVPGALLPPHLAPELARAIRAPGLAGLLAAARPLPAAMAPDSSARSDGPVPTQSPHWQWLARRFGLDDTCLATAPYAWQGLQAAGTTAAPGALGWIAHCEPVHMAIARDHFVVTDLAGADLDAIESEDLLERANAVLAAEPAACGVAAPLRLAVRAGRWFVHSPQALQLGTWALDAVLGQSVQDRLPVGADARRWRVLANEIQMSWHASDTNDARERAGTRTANALWLHGGGAWQPLGPRAPCVLRMDGAPQEAAVVRGWQQAVAAQAPAASRHDASGALAIWRDLFHAHAHQAWESWVQLLPLLETRIETEQVAARAAGARVLHLVLCGTWQSRTIALPLQNPWWRRLVPARQGTPALLQRWLTEPSGVGAGYTGATPGALAA